MICSGISYYRRQASRPRPTRSRTRLPQANCPRSRGTATARGTAPQGSAKTPRARLTIRARSEIGTFSGAALMRHGKCLHIDGKFGLNADQTGQNRAASFRGRRSTARALESPRAPPLPIYYDHWSKTELDRQFSPSLWAKDTAGVLARHKAETAALLTASDLRVTRDLRYGPAPRSCLDIVRPVGVGRFPCLVFVHGGFWQEGSKAGSGFAARSLARHGWASALVGYSLTPEVQVADIIAEIAAALACLKKLSGEHNLDPARLILAGHSAGAHLVAALIAGLGGDDAAASITGALLVSGVYDLAPVAASYVNDLARLDTAAVKALSPLARRPMRDVPLHILTGADEPPGFLDQSKALAQTWAPHLSVLTSRQALGRDHFDVLDELADPASPSFKTLMEMSQ